MPQTSSSGMSHRQVATAFHSLMVTFMRGTGWRRDAAGAALLLLSLLLC